MKKILSGIQSSGVAHLGNYLGAMRQHIHMQEKYQCTYMIADLHALTTVRDPAVMQESAINLVLDYLALGLDPQRTTIFRQSAVAYHSELAWILSCVAHMGLLERAHAWKDALSKGTKDPTVALFTYPILMAADILLYEPDLVPVGRDQKQHIEICRDIAVKFNNMFGSVFKLPEEFIIEETAVVVGTDGERKMSKSLGNVINFFADEATLRKQVMGIKTDSKGVDEPKNPNDSAIVSLYKHFASPDELIDLESRFLSGIGYGDSKKILFEAIMDYFRPYREKRIELKNNMDYIYQVLENGNKKAISQAESVISRVKEKTGLC